LGSVGRIFGDEVGPTLASVSGSARMTSAHKNPLPVVRRVVGTASAGRLVPSALASKTSNEPHGGRYSTAGLVLFNARSIPSQSPARPVPRVVIEVCAPSPGSPARVRRSLRTAADGFPCADVPPRARPAAAWRIAFALKRSVAGRVEEAQWASVLGRQGLGEQMHPRRRPAGESRPPQAGPQGLEQHVEAVVLRLLQSSGTLVLGLCNTPDGGTGGRLGRQVSRGPAPNRIRGWAFPACAAARERP
jgi:hypothetical protein